MLQRLLLALTASFCPAFAHAATTVCPTSYVGGAAPDFAKISQAAPTRELCFRQFSVMHSGATRTPLWSAEHLTADEVARAGQTVRVDKFHAESKLPKAQRSELTDYRKSGYDRGHMAPSGDMPNATSQRESFSLANMVPQNHALNTGIWSRIESTVRDVATTDGDVWVVTGPLFLGNDVQALRGRVLVPTQTWKAVYDPTRQGVAVYVADNDDTPNCRIMTVAAFQKLSGIDPFPGLPAGTTKLPLTQPAACR